MRFDYREHLLVNAHLVRNRARTLMNGSDKGVQPGVFFAADSLKVPQSWVAENVLRGKAVTTTGVAPPMDLSRDLKRIPTHGVHPA